MATSSQDQPFYAYVMSPEFRAVHDLELFFRAWVEQNQQERQRQEEAEFSKRLDSMELAELMGLQRQTREEADKQAAALKAVRQGDMSALNPYMGVASQSPFLNETFTYYQNGMSLEDLDRVIAAKRAKNIPDDVPSRETSSFSPIQKGQDPTQQLEETKKWLQETFKGKPTDALLIKTSDGEYAVASLGVSDAEVTAARALQNDQQRSEARSAGITSRIQEKIREQSQQTPSPNHDQDLSKLVTPAVKSLSISSSRDV